MCEDCWRKGDIEDARWGVAACETAKSSRTVVAAASYVKIVFEWKPNVGTHYFVVSVIAPLQNLIPAVDPVATGVFINNITYVSRLGTTYMSYTGLSTLDPAMFCRCIQPLNSLEHLRCLAGRLRLRNI